jgi:Rieske Fe-S protein
VSLSRRRLLKASAAGGLALAVGGGCGVRPPPVYEAAVQDDPTLPSSYGTVRLRLADVPDLLFAGGAATLRLAPLDDPERARPFQMPSPPELLVIRRAGGGTLADAWAVVESACPHLGCPLGYDPAADLIECPCHRSRFLSAPRADDLTTCTGKPMAGPARQGPPAYAARLDATLGVLTIDLTQPAGCGTLRLPPVIDGRVSLTLTDFPQLAAPDGAISGRPLGLAHDLLLVRVSAARDASAIRAVDPACPHLGCSVRWSSEPGVAEACGAAPGRFVCPCHCSRFDSAGLVELGPAARDLRRFEVSFDGETVVVQLA